MLEFKISQEQIALYLFNSINSEIRKNTNIYKMLDMYKQKFYTVYARM